MANLDCDVLIVGSGIGGLSTGALLSKRGQKVIVLGQTTQAGGELATFERDGYLFQATNSIFSGFELGGGHERLLAELNILLTREHLDPSWQLILPNHRVNFYNDRVALLEELKREFPQEITGTRAFFKHIDEIEAAFFDLYQHKNFVSPHNIKEKYYYMREVQNKLTRMSGGLENTGAKYFKEYLHNPEFKKLLDLAVFFYSLHPLEQCPGLLTAFILSICKRGTVYFPGGNQKLVNSLLKSLQSHGGQIKYKSKVGKVIIERQQAVGVELSDGSTIRARDVIVNGNLAYLYQNLLPKNSVSGKIRKKLEMLKPEWVPFTVYLGVDEEVLPYMVRENVFLCNDYHKPIGDTHTLFINISPKKDTDRAPDGMRALTVTCFLPYMQWQRDSNYKRLKTDTTEEIIEQLSKFIDFIRDGIKYQEAATPLTYQDHLQSPYGVLTGLAHTPTGFGFNGFSSHTGFKRLWILGDDTFPGRGSDLASIGAANLVNQLSQR